MIIIKCFSICTSSYFDNWGLVVNEAVVGLPCIVSQNCGCAVDLIKNEETGFVFNPNKNNGAKIWKSRKSYKR